MNIWDNNWKIDFFWGFCNNIWVLRFFLGTLNACHTFQRWKNIKDYGVGSKWCHLIIFNDVDLWYDIWFIITSFLVTQIQQWYKLWAIQHDSVCNSTWRFYLWCGTKHNRQFHICSWYGLQCYNKLNIKVLAQYD